MTKDEKHGRRNPILLLLSVALLILGTVILLLPKDFIVGSHEKEKQMIVRCLGTATEERIRLAADSWFERSFIDTGFLYATYNFFGKYEEDGKFDDRGLAKLIDRRLDVLWLTLHLVYYRFSLLLAWLPYLVPMVLVASIDGMLQREIRKWQFSFSSPLAHRSASRLMILIVLSFVALPFLPVPTHPFAMPIMMGILAVASWVNLANIQKRI